MFPQRSRVLVGALYALVAAIVMLGAGLPGAAQTPEAANIIGTWNVTSDPGTPEERFGVALINDGGTVSYVSSGLQRQEGAWRKTGPRSFEANLQLFEADGSRFRVRATIRMVDKNTFSATTTVDLLNGDGTLLQAGIGFDSLDGTRMPIVPQ